MGQNTDARELPLVRSDVFPGSPTIAVEFLGSGAGDLLVRQLQIGGIKADFWIKLVTLGVDQEGRAFLRGIAGHHGTGRRETVAASVQFLAGSTVVDEATWVEELPMKEEQAFRLCWKNSELVRAFDRLTTARLILTARPRSRPASH